MGERREQENELAAAILAQARESVRQLRELGTLLHVDGHTTIVQYSGRASDPPTTAPASRPATNPSGEGQNPDSLEEDEASLFPRPEVMEEFIARARFDSLLLSLLLLRMSRSGEQVEGSASFLLDKLVEKPAKADTGEIFQLDQCCICLSAKPTIRASPCGHVFACAHCASCYLAAEEKQPCPICREPIHDSGEVGE